MFSGKVVLITGASSGIGAVTAVAFAKLDANVVITGRRVENLIKVAADCEEVSKKKPLIVAGDLSQEEFIKTLIDSTIKHFKKLDVLVNNAAWFGTFGSVENGTLQQFDEMFNLNVRSVYYLTHLAVPYLIESKGNIVNVSSIVGLRGSANLLFYSMSKSALDQFTRCTALDLAGKGVRVNSVNPGVVETEFLNSVFSNEEADKFFEENCRKAHPLGRAAKPQEIAEAVVFLASEKSSFTTGVLFSVDGGWHVTVRG